MPYEVEMKAWIDDWHSVERRLRDACVFERSFRKEDRYYSANDSTFRLRLDDGAATVTYKEKSIRGGVEFNLEREFAVDDPDAFVDLVVRLGCREQHAKVKEGLHFVRDDLTVELVRVEGLGDFLEVEYLHPDDDEQRHEDAARRIRAFIEQLGVDPTRIEGRPYVELLQRAR
ncbi:MAG: class IV adenylate cyclase [Spirochaetota bacterium]